MKRIGFVALAAFIATIPFANWLVTHFGLIHVGFGLKAPAAVLSVGVAFTLRDIVHRTLGPVWVIGAILVGAALSYIVAPSLALASGVAFLISESADLAVYTPLERKSWLGAVALSNTVGLLIDSLVFVGLAWSVLSKFGVSFDSLVLGQVVGKAWMTVLTIAVIAAIRGARALRTATA